MLLETIAKNAAALRRTGPDAIERAKRLGVPVFYQDPQRGPGFIKEYPDGRQERVDLQDLKEVVLDTNTL